MRHVYQVEHSIGRRWENKTSRHWHHSACPSTPVDGIPRKEADVCPRKLCREIRTAQPEPHRETRGTDQHSRQASTRPDAGRSPVRPGADRFPAQPAPSRMTKRATQRPRRPAPSKIAPAGHPASVFDRSILSFGPKRVQSRTKELGVLWEGLHATHSDGGRHPAGHPFA